MPSTISRGFPPSSFDRLTSYGIHPVLARIYAARGIEEPTQLEVDWSRLLPFKRLKKCLPDGEIYRRRDRRAQAYADRRGL